MELLNNNKKNNLAPTSSHLHQLQVENCDSNTRLVVDEDDNGKFGLIIDPNINREEVISITRFTCI